MFDFLLHILAEETNGETLLDTIRPFVFVAGIVLAAYMLMRWSQKRIMQNHNRSNLSVQDRVEKTRKGSEIYSQIGELMSQLADLSRQINGQIDTRIAKLELLISEADQKIAHLEKLSRNNSHNSNNSELNQQKNGIETLRQISEQYHQLDLSQPPPEDPHSNLPSSGKSEPQDPSNQNPKRPQNKSDISLENQQIIRLSQQGMSPVQIAQELNRPIGEIELILSLNGKKYQ